MSYNTTNMYAIDAHIAEIYDQSETYHDDVDLLLSLIAPLRTEERRFFRILEPFCGNGRILIPLAQAGHTLVGLDQALCMLDHARQKLSRLPGEVQSRVSLHRTDVIVDKWPLGFDLVILGGNCLYELASPEEQGQVIRSAAASLRPGGYIYVDNDHMEGALSSSWQVPGVRRGFPTGTCADGTQVASTTETIWFDIPARLAKFRRTTRIYPPRNSEAGVSTASSGKEIEPKLIEAEYIQQKHPVSFSEVQAWLERYGFGIEKTFGDRAENLYTSASERAIFWARKGSGGNS